MASRGTILVADDEGLARRSIAELLQEEGYQVYEAADGKAALQLLDEVDVDVVLTDTCQICWFHIKCRCCWSIPGTVCTMTGCA